MLNSIMSALKDAPPRLARLFRSSDNNKKNIRSLELDDKRVKFGKNEESRGPTGD